MSLPAEQLAVVRRANQEYWTRERLRHYLAGMSLEPVWEEVERVRASSAQILPLVDERGRAYRVWTTSRVLASIHGVDRHGADSMFRAADPAARQRNVAESLVQEAFHSSKIEGAVTTLDKARELAAGKASPSSRSERMVLNNYRAMQRLLGWRSRPLAWEDVAELHGVITEGAYEGRDGTAGRLRAGDSVRVVDRATDEVVHVPPPAADLPRMIDALVRYMGEATAAPESRGDFVHPLVRASAVHYYLAYLHPFYDGNGRIARALFYHLMLRAGYDSFQYLSVSSVIDRRRGQYYRAFREVEASPHDLTYFVLFSCAAAETAVEALRERVLAEFGAGAVLERLRERRVFLSDRQQAWLRRALRAPQRPFAIQDLQRAMRVSYPTAREDVLDLVAKGLVAPAHKVRKKQLYVLNDALLLG